MDYKVIDIIEKAVNKLEYKNYSINIEMKDGNKITLVKEEKEKDKKIGFSN